MVPRGGMKQLHLINYLCCPTLARCSIAFQGVFSTLSHRFLSSSRLVERGSFKQVVLPHSGVGLVMPSTGPSLARLKCFWIRKSLAAPTRQGPASFGMRGLLRIATGIVMSIACRKTPASLGTLPAHRKGKYSYFLAPDRMDRGLWLLCQALLQ